MVVLPAGCQWKLLVCGEHTGGRFAAVEARMCRGAEPPRHVHSREDEFVYVLEGRVTFSRDEERLDGSPGTWMFLPCGSEHGFAVESEHARLLVVLSPAGLEGCLRELAHPDDRTGEFQAVERLVATAARYGLAITGPRWSPEEETSSGQSGVDAA
jgi:quercetin dioxygenase-like cupin family protein